MHSRYCLHFLVKSDTIQDFYLTYGQLWAPSYWEIKNFCALLKLIITSKQRAKKVVSDSLGLVDFSIGLVNSVLNLPEKQMKFFQEFTNYRRTAMNTAHSNIFFKLVDMTFGLLLSKLLKLTFFGSGKGYENLSKPVTKHKIRIQVCITYFSVNMQFR